MSEKNKALLRRANEAIVRGDHEGFLAHCTDDVAWTFVGERTLTGKAAVRAYMRAAYAEPPRFTVDRLIAEGDFVTALGEIETADAAGRPVRSAYCDVWRVRGDQLAELTAFVVEVGRDGGDGA